MALREEFLHLLKTDPEFHEEIRRLILTEELMGLPSAIGRLERSISHSFDSLREEMRDGFQQVNARIDGVQTEMREGFQTVGGQIERLTLQQKRTTDRLGDFRGMFSEDKAADVIWKYIHGQGWKPLTPYYTLYLNGDWEIDGLVQVQDNEGKVFWILVDARAKMRPSDIRQLASRMRSKRVIQHLRREGITGTIYPWAFTGTLLRGLDAIAQEHGIGLFESRLGLVVPAQPIEV